MLKQGALALLLIAPALHRDTGLPDLEVGVPPGSPTAWARWIPAQTPRPEPLAPLTGTRSGRGGTVVAQPSLPLDPRIGGAGVLRITTADVPGHLPWVNGPPRQVGPLTGPAGRALPMASQTLQWIGTAAFLRYLLHRQQVSRAEIAAHLVELGEPMLWCTEAAAAEPGLGALAKEVQVLIERRGRGSALPAGANPREAMLLRFVAGELARAHPFDPEGMFGRRLYVFATDVEPLLVRFLGTDADAFLVRNAAAALGRYRTSTAQAALAAAAASTEDPVVLMRALAALEPGCATAPLLARLDRSTDAVETAALVAALGRIADPAAAAKLVGVGRRVLRGDPDLLMTVMIALCRIPIGVTDREVPAFAETVWRAARTGGGRFEVEHDARVLPDVPDRESLRGEILEQLAVALRVRCAAGERALDDLRELLAEPRASRPGGSFANRAAGVAWPPAQIPVVEALPRLPDGTRALQAIVEDGSSDPVLRVVALAHLPVGVRGPLASRLLAGGGPDLPSELALAAMQVLDLDGAADLAERGRVLLEASALTPPGLGSAPQRALWLAAVQALDRRSALRAADLLPLLDHVRADPGVWAGDVAARRAALFERATALVDELAAGLRARELEARVAAFVEFLIAARIDRRFTAATREATVQYVLGLLAGVPKKRKDAAYKVLVARSIVDYVQPERAGSLLAGTHEFVVAVPFEESVVLALGRTREPEAVHALAALLEQRDLGCLGEVCLAAGLTGSRSLLQPLARRLLDGDGFVRFCAYEALRKSTGKDFWADWLYGDVAERGAAAQEWFRWCAKAGG
jgi:hypothetical protein